MSISDEDLSKTIEILTDLLSDARYLANDTKAKQAVEKLKQLEANTLTISTSDITTILDEEFKVLVARQQENALKAISTEREEVQKKMLDDVKNAFANMQTVTLHHLDQIVATKMSEIQQVAEKEKKELTEISAKGKQQIEEEIRKGKGVALSEEETETNTKQRELEKYLRDDLVSFYRKYHSTIPVSPLVEEHDVPLLDFYVQPPLSSVDIQKKFGRIQESRTRKQVHNLNDIFLKPDGKIYKDIYITAKAGVGKTSFVNRICMVWCQAHCPQKELENKFKPEEVTVMKSFTCLFMITLRDIDTSLCNVDDMIFNQIIRNLSRFRRYNEIFIEDILQEKDCLL
ncbi:uncharacterized protein LOC128548484 [Mercenaria mercenaria]|uniref:uncharacterized protein LOC128548484 n=1 Tax=Mercenaria mercenaria TaxID=6596 RepID=UPI00234EEEA2|nr:uncharacterized protein LOC128548484 [Mercenaria mercenaria]